MTIEVETGGRMRYVLWAMTIVSAAALQDRSLELRDIDGRAIAPSGSIAVRLFVSSECPMSNAYAPEIQRLCSTYAKQGVACVLVYEDARIDAAAVRTHLDTYAYRGIPAAIDADGSLAARVGASVTPEVVVLGASLNSGRRQVEDARGGVRYRGRIDNLYAAIGKRRQHATEHDLRDALEALLAGRPVPAAETKALGCYIEKGQR